MMWQEYVLLAVMLISSLLLLCVLAVVLLEMDE